MPDWAAVCLGLAVVVWSFVGMFVVEKPLVSWYVGRSQGNPNRAAALGFLTQVAWVVPGLVVYGLSGLLADAEHSRAWVVLPAVAVYLPFAFNFLPSRALGYRALRKDLVDAGAPHSVARALTWVSGPLALLGCSFSFVFLYEVLS